MNILFMGTPECAVPSLASLYDSPHKLVGVITQPDKEKGRKRILTPSPVKVFALEHGLSCETPLSVRKDLAFNKQVSEVLKPDLVIVVAFGQILLRNFLEIPPLGCINLHFSLLPEYRGASPVARALIDGKTQTGVSTQYMNEGVDEGDIIFQEKISVDISDNRFTLETRLAAIGANLLLKTLAAIESGSVPRIPQDSAQATYCPKITTDMGKINWSQSGTSIHNLVRGLNPDPVAFTFFRNQRIRILETSPMMDASEMINEKAVPGEYISIYKGKPQGIKIQTGDGVLLIQSLQPDGKKPMNAMDFANGYRIQPGERFEQGL